MNAAMSELVDQGGCRFGGKAVEDYSGSRLIEAMNRINVLAKLVT
jgi:hypothetical protein